MMTKRKPKKNSLANSYSVVASDITVHRCLDRPTYHQSLELYKGTLVNVNSPFSSTYDAIKIVDLEKHYSVSEEDLWLCPRDALIHVDQKVWPVLSAVPSPDERVYLLTESDLLDQLLKIENGSVVNVVFDDGDSVVAVVKYKGPIPKKGPGVYFGVELLEGEKKGTCNGTYGNQTLFSCPPGTGMFVSVDRLRPLKYPSPRNYYKSVHHSQQTTDMNKQCIPVHNSNIPERFSDCEKNGASHLCIGDRVVWISDDDGPHKLGTVEELIFKDTLLKVTVLFDEPVRTEYIANSQTGMTKSATIPAFELVKASDFYGIEDNKLTNGDSYWKNGASSIKETNNKLNQVAKDFITLNSPLICEDGASSGSEGSVGYYDTPDSSSGESFTIGSLVEVVVKGEPYYGVIRWIGTLPGEKRSRKIAGIEMEDDHPLFGDGSVNGSQYFKCNPRKSYFVPLYQCRHDSRFHDSPYKSSTRRSEDFGGVDSPIISGIIAPMSREGDISAICGKYRGIQGHHNSCYLDATLFSMFTFTSVFDGLLYRPASTNDIPHYDQVQKVLREEIVNPLRKNLFVRADRVMKLRTLMEKLSSVSGLTTEEKDPEEFLTSLVAQILKAEPFLKLSSGQEAYHYQLFVEKDEALILPTVQQLFEQSFLSSDLKLKEVPSCLIIQMPRFGKSFKMYPRILPSQLLDVTDVIENSPRQCTVCGNLAQYECKECFEQCDVGLQSISFCSFCLERAHNHERRRKHSWRQLSVPIEFEIIKDHCFIPRLYMQLFAVVCIETSHYVTFVKCGTGADAPWCFFDSMADRKGEQNGYNIPEMVACPDLPFWLSEKGAGTLQQIKDERQLPEHAKRLLCDAYMCMYQSNEVMMYR